jgi:hypothetical protein
MQDLPLIRRLELGLVTGATGLYAWRRLAAEVSAPAAFAQAARQSGVPGSVLARDLSGYDLLLNGTLPMVAGALLLLGAWIVFHYLASPSIRRAADVPGILLSVGVTVLLAGAAVFVYYYFKRYIRFRIDDDGAIIGLKVYGLYRKRLLLSEVVGIGIVFGLFELASGAYYALHQRLSEAYGRYPRYGSYALLALTGGLVLSLALIVVLPDTLWYPGLAAYLLLAAGALLLGYALQSYLHRVLPAGQTLPPVQLVPHLLGYVAVALAGSLLLWGAYRGWEGVHPHAVGGLFAGVAGAAAVVVYLRRALRRENLQLQTQVSAKAAELDNLRAQINPHFLFNALNTLYASALKEGSEGTAEGIRQLAEMMRFMLEENHQQCIPLTKEVEFLRNYIDIQRLRLDEKRGIDIRVNLETPPDGVGIAPMLLNPLVENAFKHGISLQNPSWIHITLTLDEQHLYFRVHNSCHDRTGPDPEQARRGVGQENVKKRLELLYPGRHRLDIQPTGQDYFVSLMLQYRDGRP